MLRIKKNDIVKVTTGKDKGKSGKVIEVYPKIERALVEGINLVKKAKRKTQQDQQGGIVDIEAPIHLSNLMLIDKQSDQPTRYKISVLKDGGKERVGKRSGAVV